LISDLDYSMPFPPEEREHIVVDVERRSDERVAALDALDESDRVWLAQRLVE
jgi:hypothetical protein